MMKFPASVNPNQLTAFLKSVYSSNGVIHIHELADDLNWDLTKLLPILDAAQMLQLVTVENGEAKITRKGERIVTIKKGRARELRKLLLQVEPFKTALQFKEKFNGEDVARELSEKGVRWHYEDDLNSVLVNELLVRWGIGLRIVDYDGSCFTLHFKTD